MKALILAAGIGERLRPLTNDIPKVMVEVCGKPCLQYNIELLKKYGITDIGINTHYLPKSITDYFGDGSRFGVKIRYSFEPIILGTSGALNNFRDFFQEDFLVIYGDVIHKTDIGKMVSEHNKKKGIGMIALDKRSQIGKGAVILEKGLVKKFVEKPCEEINGALVNSGIYVLNPKIFDYIPEGVSDFGKGIFPDILRKGLKLYGFEGEEVIDIGTFEDLKKARRLLSQE